VVLRPRNLGRRYGLPHESPETPQQNATNAKHALSAVASVQRLLHHGVVQLQGFQDVDPADPKPGTGIVYLFDDGVTPEFRVRYTQDDGTVLTGAVTLA
jgi:hypothetical protein